MQAVRRRRGLSAVLSLGMIAIAVGPVGGTAIDLGGAWRLGMDDDGALRLASWPSSG